eukprot:CAMPEP_0173440780 /NCGR_PEP_ID=MMETSP1357-20121228/23608_1 /TAXON_ID=77926 /ORGANISM="Hemiselmis rufescens, Strain PCC563" /LENGTH=172 /DNA_ID=CAMNT_0014406317 /DNA_START=25 /DNA_END=539 /DNA_ORIENTATION=+
MSADKRGNIEMTNVEAETKGKAGKKPANSSESATGLALANMGGQSYALGWMRDSGAADTGDMLWQHQEALKERVMTQHVKRAENSLVNNFRKQQESSSLAAPDEAPPKALFAAKSAPKTSQKQLLSKVLVAKKPTSATTSPAAGAGDGKKRSLNDDNHGSEVGAKKAKADAG